MTIELVSLNEEKGEMMVRGTLTRGEEDEDEEEEKEEGVETGPVKKKKKKKKRPYATVECEMIDFQRRQLYKARRREGKGVNVQGATNYEGRGSSGAGTSRL